MEEEYSQKMEEASESTAGATELSFSNAAGSSNGSSRRRSRASSAVSSISATTFRLDSSGNSDGAEVRTSVEEKSLNKYREDSEESYFVFSEETSTFKYKKLDVEEKHPVTVVVSDLRSETKPQEVKIYEPVGSSELSSDSQSEISHKKSEQTLTLPENRYLMTELFLDTWCVRNGDGTKDLVLIGEKLQERIKRRADDYDVKIIVEFLSERPKVIGVDLSYNLITDKYFKTHFIPFLKTNTSLKYLNLANNEIKGDGLDMLQESSKYFSLLELRLNGNPLGPKGGQAVASMIAKNRSIIHLDLGQTDQNMSSLAAIAARLNMRYAPSSCTLHGLQPRPKSPESNPVEKGCRNKNSTTAEEIQITYAMKNIPRWRCAHPDTKYCFWHLQTNLEDTLNPVNNHIKILNLDRILPHYHYLLLTDHFARIISDMLENNMCLVELHLEKNNLMDGDIEQLCKGLAVNKTLQLLNLSSNRIGNLGACHIAKAIETSFLTALVMNHNRISDEGAKSFSFKIPFSKLRFLDLAYNKIGDAGMVSLLNIVRNKMLVFYIWGNPISTETEDQVTAEIGYTRESSMSLILIIRDYIYTGAILSQGLDVEIEQERSRLQAAFTMSDKYKSRYYGGVRGPRPIRKTAPPPPMYLPKPIDFKHRDILYGRTMQRKIPSSGIDTCDLAGTCAS